MAKKTDGFVSLSSLRGEPTDPAAALAEIRRIYFETTKQTVEGDFAHAVELLKSLPTEELREKATVFMQGLNEMLREWQRRPTRSTSRKAPLRPSRTKALRKASG
jgi:hypothetical protein